MCNEFLSCPDVKVPKVYQKAEVAERRHAQIRILMKRDYWL